MFNQVSLWACSTTHKNAPRVLILTQTLFPHWANWEHFNELDKEGLMMYSPNGSGKQLWIYIGSPRRGFEIFLEHFVAIAKTFRN
ncbi:hypothetical protein O9992_01310 [Vibrio lentus]|nr:hypothetical protein [Vibrio lentus]